MNGTNPAGLMMIVGHEPCNRCGGTGTIRSQGCNYRCSICIGTGDQPIYGRSTTMSIRFDPPEDTT